MRLKASPAFVGIHAVEDEVEASVGSIQGMGVNLRHQREGHLFRSPFWSGPIETMEHLVVSVSYVALNPVRPVCAAIPRIGRGRLIESSPDSSLPRVVKADGVLSFLGNNDIARGRAAYARMIEDDLERLRCTPATPPLQILASSIQHAGRSGEAKASPHARTER